MGVGGRFGGGAGCAAGAAMNAVRRPGEAMAAFTATAEGIVAQVYDAGLRAGADRRRPGAVDRARTIAFAVTVLSAHAELVVGQAQAAAGEEAVDGQGD